MGRGPAAATTFSYTGGVQTFVVPAGVTKLTVEAYGAEGGADGAVAGGKGGEVKGEVTVTPGSTVYVYVGGKGTDGPGSGQNCNLAGGFNGGGPTGTTCCSNAGAGAAAGGGASDIRLNGQALANRVLIAGGAGGAGDNQTGGDGGGLVGGDGGTYQSVTAKGGTQSAGGAPGGHYTNHACSAGTAGTLGQGGTGDGNDGGGAGGGWYGGGGGPNNGGGAGGSSYWSVAVVSNATTATGTRTGNGEIKISW